MTRTLHPERDAATCAHCARADRTDRLHVTIGVSAARAVLGWLDEEASAFEASAASEHARGRVQGARLLARELRDSLAELVTGCLARPPMREPGDDDELD